MHNPNVRSIQTAFTILIFAAMAGPSQQTLASPRNPRVGTMGYDLDYVMTPAEASRKSDDEGTLRRGQISLQEIVRIGGRAVQWADLIQKDIPVERREQVWRRIDRLGHEATADAPMVYNRSTIRQDFNEALSVTPQSVQALIRGHQSLPETIPSDTNLQEAIVGIRKIQVAYSRASRWLALLQWRNELDKGQRDLRPWLSLKKQAEAMERIAADWNHQSRNQRQAWIRLVATACPIGGTSMDECIRRHRGFLNEESSGGPSQWFSTVLNKGQEAYDAKFGVTSPHEGVNLIQQSDGQVNVVFSMLNLTGEMYDWIAEQVSVGWHFPGSISVQLHQTLNPSSGVVKVQWEQGALPHVNDVGGDTIVMDSNTAKWLEQTQITMTHEFGHVIGFPDCYVEFWDDNAQSFVFYTLDPDDRMCALSGGTLDRHRQALLAGFGN